MNRLLSLQTTFWFLVLHISISHALRADTTEPITVMTYNVLYDDTKYGNKQIWHKRKQDVARIMRGADIIGTQEPTFSQVQYLKEELQGYDALGVGNVDGKQRGLFCAIFYRTEKFQPLTSGTFWLSPRPDQPGSRGWDAQSLRITTWAKFADCARGHAFFVFNTHFDHRGKRARQESAHLLLEKIDTIAGDTPVIVLGDLNAEEDHPAYKILTQNGHALLRHAYDSTERSKRRGPDWTFVKNFKQGGSGKRRIDFIFARGPDIRFDDYEVIDQKASYGGYPSDHLPVMATLRIRADGTQGLETKPCAGHSMPSRNPE